MNAQQKAIVKIEVCRNMLGNLSSEKEASTLLWMKQELDNAFIAVCSDPTIRQIHKDIDKASAFVNAHAEAINAPVPEKVLAIFMLSAMGYVFVGFNDTNKEVHFTGLLDGCLELDGVTGSEDDIKQRKLAAVFADNLDNIINRG